MRLSDLLTADAIHLNLRSRTKETVIKSLVKHAAQTHGLDEKHVLDAVLERERALSTGVGQRVAVPHATLRDLDKAVIVIGRTAQGVDFDSIDGDPVRIVFLLLSPDGDVPLHLKLLSRISRICQKPSLRETLLSATSPEIIEDAIKLAEQGYQDL